MKRSRILKLNKNFLPAAVSPYREVIKNIFTDAVYPLDLHFEQAEDGSINFESLEGFDVIKSLKEWLKLPIRPYDDYINSPSRTMRLPAVVVCTDFNKVLHSRAIFPTKRNIWERDSYTCCYTMEKLTRENLSIDHVIPKSRCEEFGIEPNTWENLVTCKKSVNNEKDNRTPKEAGLSLKKKPYRPRRGWVLEEVRDQWKPFLG